jgi:hypothetical protein
MSVGLGTYFNHSTRNDGADIGGPLIALLAATALAMVAMIAIGARSHAAHESVGFVCVWLAVAADAALAGVSATDVGFGFRLAFDVVVSFAAMGVAGLISAALADTLHRTEGVHGV